MATWSHNLGDNCELILELAPCRGRGEQARWCSTDKWPQGKTRWIIGLCAFHAAPLIDAGEAHPCAIDCLLVSTGAVDLGKDLGNRMIRMTMVSINKARLLMRT